MDNKIYFFTGQEGLFLEVRDVHLNQERITNELRNNIW